MFFGIPLSLCFLISHVWCIRFTMPRDTTWRSFSWTKWCISDDTSFWRYVVINMPVAFLRECSPRLPFADISMDIAVRHSIIILFNASLHDASIAIIASVLSAISTEFSTVHSLEDVRPTSSSAIEPYRIPGSHHIHGHCTVHY